MGIFRQTTFSTARNSSAVQNDVRRALLQSQLTWSENTGVTVDSVHSLEAAVRPEQNLVRIYVSIWDYSAIVTQYD
jgi:hypothetical protein